MGYEGNIDREKGKKERMFFNEGCFVKIVIIVGIGVNFFGEFLGY